MRYAQQVARLRQEQSDPMPWSRLCAQVCFVIAELVAGDESGLGSSVFDLSVLFWTYKGRAHSKSAFIYFSAVSDIDNHKGYDRLPPIYG